MPFALVDELIRLIFMQVELQRLVKRDTPVVQIRLLAEHSVGVVSVGSELVVYRDRLRVELRLVVPNVKPA